MQSYQTVINYVLSMSEDFALSAANRAYVYAVHVLKSRWEAAESIIGDDAVTARRYTEFIAQRWPHGDAFAIRNVEFAANYFLILRQRDSAFERNIFSPSMLGLLMRYQGELL